MGTEETIYEWMVEDGEERSCEAISEEDCKEVPGNFIKNTLSGFSSKLAEQLVSPSITLPWMLSILGVSSVFTGMLVPLKNLGSLLPQLFVSAKIRSFPIRKYFWGIPAFIQGLIIALMGLAMGIFEKNSIGILIVVLLLLFSIASGVSSVAFKDVMGKTIPKGKRGRLLATRATGGGVLTLVFGLALFFYISGQESKHIIFILISAAVVLWFLAGLFFVLIKESKGATGGGRTPVQELKKGFEFFKTDKNLRCFVFSRAFLMAIPLAQPFFVLIGKENTAASFSGLGLFVIASGLAALISSPFWGKFADRSSRKLMIVVAIFGIVNCFLVLGFMYLEAPLQNIYLFAPIILLNMMAHGGARLSRKTYLTDFAPEEERPLYIALSNTLIGFFTIVTAGIGYIAELFNYQVLLLFFVFMLLVSLIFSYNLKEV